MKPPKIRVLIVDDNASDRLIVKSMLYKIGFKEIQEAEDGSIASNKIHTGLQINQPFELLLLDWNMPKTNGLKLLQQIRKDYQTRKIKIIIMTATADMVTVQDAIKNGADDFIVKPIGLDTLKEKVTQLYPEP